MTHPDIEELLDSLGAILPTECRNHRTPYPGMSSTELRCSSSLDYEGITFAMCRGTDILFRLPENVRKEVLASGGKQDVWSNQEWVSAGNYHEHKRLVRLAYDYAVELAATRSKQTLESQKIITSCPNCSQLESASGYLLKEYHGRRGGLSIAFIRNGEVIDKFEIRGE
jgi:hypothetical protein